MVSLLGNIQKKLDAYFPRNLTNLSKKIKTKYPTMNFFGSYIHIYCFILILNKIKAVLNAFIAVHILIRDVWILEKRGAEVVPPDRPDPTSE